MHRSAVGRTLAVATLLILALAALLACSSSGDSSDRETMVLPFLAYRIEKGCDDHSQHGEDGELGMGGKVGVVDFQECEETQDDCAHTNDRFANSIEHGQSLLLGFGPDSDL